MASRQVFHWLQHSSKTLAVIATVSATSASSFSHAEEKRNIINPTSLLYEKPTGMKVPSDSVELVEHAPMRKRMEALIRRTQHEICSSLEELDGQKFRHDEWIRENGSGRGITKCLQGGNVFEKAGVNISIVEGNLGPSAIHHMKSRGKDLFEGNRPLPYFACGISMVLHPHNPLAPTMHLNYRYFEVDSGREDADGNPIALSWFGGGADLTPSYVIEEDAKHFHGTYKNTLCQIDEDLYSQMKDACDEYFYIPHRQERRGVGGIFFDDLEDNVKGFKIATMCANATLDAYLPILKKRINMPFTNEQKEWQQIRRGRYVEFNLMYDRGTKFGLAIPNSRIESILMSLPLTSRYEYMNVPKEGSWEEASLKDFKGTRDWTNEKPVNLLEFSTGELFQELARRTENIRV